jgi:hypothetical protein
MMNGKQLEDHVVGLVQTWLPGPLDQTPGEPHQHRVQLLPNSPEDEANVVTLEVQTADTRAQEGLYRVTISAERVDR